MNDGGDTVGGDAGAANRIEGSARARGRALADPAVLEAERQALIRAVDAVQLNNLERRVAWLLNRYPEARDSDSRLYRHYWTTFEQDLLDGEYVHLNQIGKVTQPTSMTRARAFIQNDLKLFLASAEVQSRRGTLSAEEKARVLAQPRRQLFPTYAAYADESGKTDDHLVVGSAWFLHGPDQLAAVRAVEAVKMETRYKGELHFKAISEDDLPVYMAVMDRVLAEAPTVAFTSASVERRGHKNVDEALRQLYYHLMLRSIQHHHDTGRAPLPRALVLIKDAENPGPDKLLLADLEDRLHQAGNSLYGGSLAIERFGSDDSGQSLPLQLADLYTGAVSRTLNQPGGRKPKDRFAQHVLQRLGQPQLAAEVVGDLSIHLRLG